MSYSNGPKLVTNGLVLYLDAANPKSYISGSNTWNDLSGNNLSGSLTNGPTYNSANKGSIVFDGIDDYVSTSEIKFSCVGGYTLEVWMKFSTLSGAQGVSSLNGGGKFINFWKASNQMRWETSQGQTITGDAILSSNTWYHFVGTHNGSTVSNLYINGSLNKSGTAGTQASVTGSVVFGAYLDTFYANNNYYTNGNVAVGRLYNRALSSQEILQNYNSTKGRYNL